MKKSNKNLSFAKKFDCGVQKIVSLYYDRINTSIENENLTFEELNKIIVAISKNIPELFKLKSTLEGIINNSESDRYENKILKLLRNDPESKILIENLLFKISNLSEDSAFDINI